MEKFVGKVVFSEVLANVLVFFWDALIVWMVCGVLLPVFPALACLAGLSYLDWVGIFVALNVLYRHIGRLFKALWGKG